MGKSDQAYVNGKGTAKDLEDPSVRSVGSPNGADYDASTKSGMAYSDSGDSMRSYRTDIGKGELLPRPLTQS